LVALASLLENGFDFYSVFVDSAAAMLIVGSLGYGIGIVYERVVEAPLVESYREEARTRALAGSEPLAMDLPVSELKPGMRVCEQVKSSDGAILVRKRGVLTSSLISRLHEKGIESVQVEAQRVSSTTEETSSPT